MAFETFNPTMKPRVAGTSMKREQRVLQVVFGDGYEQTAADGINSEYETWTLAWPGIRNHHADEIEEFYVRQGKVKAFWYRVVGRPTAKRYKFTSFDRAQVSGRHDAITAGIREVFDIEE